VASGIAIEGQMPFRILLWAHAHQFVKRVRTEVIDFTVKIIFRPRTDFRDSSIRIMIEERNLKIGDFN